MKEKNINLQIETLVNAPEWTALDFDPQAVANTVIAQTLNKAVMPDTLKNKGLWELSISLSHADEVRRLNKQFRGKDKSTNVLSFSALEELDDGMPTISASKEPRHLGDLILCYHTLDKEAQEMDISLENHFTHLIVHGMLHILGYDHQQEEDAEEMEALEIEILDGLGIENPYALDKFVA